MDDALLVLGGSGFLGPHLLAAARAGGRRVVCAARRPDRLPGLVPREGIAKRPWDAIHEGATERLLDEVRPGAVILAAALSRVADCEADPERATRLNVELPRRVAALSRERGIRLLHVSTDLVFGARPPRGERYDEDDPPAPIHAYGRTKSAGEEAVLDTNPDALVVRLPLLFGDSGGRGLGASDAVFALLERGETPRLFVDEWRTPLEVRNAADALLEALSLPITGRLHVAGPARLSRLELGLVALMHRGSSAEEARALVQASRRADFERPDTRPADVSLDASRARALLTTPLLDPRADRG